MKKIEFLTVNDVIEIHNILTQDALDSEDPISPPGVKDFNLLESAVFRQWSGYGDYLKYDNPILNAASLCYGICCNHSLHNGNKRTALVTMLCHLDKNGFTFQNELSQDKLYSFMLKVAKHTVSGNRRKKKQHNESDIEIYAMAKWINRYTRKIQIGERSLSYNELERILKNHNIYFENPKDNKIDLIRKTIEKTTVKRIFSKNIETEKLVEDKIANIPYWPGRPVGRGLVKSIRKQAGLTSKDGVDSAQFYGNETIPEEYIQKYKKTLRRLAKT